MMGYHLTKWENLLGENGIAQKGIIPQCGERSLSVKDERVTVCFTDNYYNLAFWREELYPTTPDEELCVLAFEENKKECLKEFRELSRNAIIPPEEIYIANFYNRETLEPIRLMHLENDTKVGIEMTPLLEYIPCLEQKVYQIYKK